MAVVDRSDGIGQISRQRRVELDPPEDAGGHGDDARLRPHLSLIRAGNNAALAPGQPPHRLPEVDDVSSQLGRERLGHAPVAAGDARRRLVAEPREPAELDGRHQLGGRGG